MNQITKSLSLMLSISVVCSTAAYYQNYNYVITFVLAFVLQIAVGFIVSSIRDPLILLRAEEIENQRIELLNQQGLELKCPHCSNSSFVPIRLDEHNNYDCPHCSQQCAVYLNVTVARETNMLNVNRLTTNSIDSESITLQKIRDES